MAEQTNREKNQAASQQQAQVREQEVTVRGGKVDGCDLVDCGRPREQWEA